MVVLTDMSENVIKSEDVAPAPAKKATKPAAAKEKVVKTDSDENPKRKVAKAKSGKKFVYFDSGSAYVTKSGFRFTRENRIYELDMDEADHLLSLDNFRLPSQLELEDYYKENN